MKKQVCILAAVALASVALGDVSRASDWPTRPIRAVVPLSAGSAADIIPRVVFEQLSEQLKQPIVVDNRPGASGTIGARAVAVAPPDGYTILAHSSAHVIAPSTVGSLPYDPIKDFIPVGGLGNLPNVLVVSPSKNIKSIQELAALGKKRPITYGSIGVGSPIQMAMERLRLSAGFKVEVIPYRGAPEALLGAMTGQIDVYYSPILPALPFIRDGKLIPLVVSSPARSQALPDVPTSEEAGYPNSSYRFWIGVFVPAKTPAPVVQRLSNEIEDALKTSTVREKLGKLGVQPMSMGHEQFAAFVKDELTLNNNLARAAGILSQ
ncbi:tripartite tricarboxylate transporter substrate binding protein [Pseudolabrys taiwanensis]|uniref:Tripartite tricarboxylate transporter substrate binding protein n=1 Tax=Pseudolabrys taiwanensis TaxID=331696 RepID=A0A346A154_9HYPH|nr:tripartite tricarboxylate transporter substrate binding protein [Pseudolabrys taiwanensis]AXK82901.1 tripartite tricarboxylate transporter substrate binding protein [Pseudolabrys taiwanensis]